MFAVMLTKDAQMRPMKRTLEFGAGKPSISLKSPSNHVMTEPGVCRQKFSPRIYPNDLAEPQPSMAASWAKCIRTSCRPL